MKRFKTKIKKTRVDFILFIILVICVFLLHFYNKNISNKVINITESKIDEITTLYIKKDIMPDKIDLSDLIILYKNNKEEILYLDINYDYAYKILKDIVGKIQDNIISLEQANITNFINNQELKSNKGNLYLSVPLFLVKEGALFSNLGPKIPVKISFYEHVMGDVKTEIKEYGINNALVNVNLKLYLDFKLNIPYKEEKITKVYDLTLGSKVINGAIPEVYGGLISKSGILNV